MPRGDENDGEDFSGLITLLLNTALIVVIAAAVLVVVGMLLMVPLLKALVRFKNRHERSSRDTDQACG